MVGALKIKDQFFIFNNILEEYLYSNVFEIYISNEQQSKFMSEHFYNVNFDGKYKHEYAFSVIGLMFKSNKYVKLHGCFIIKYDESRNVPIFSYDKIDILKNLTDLFKEDELIYINSLKNVNKFNL